jgi:hypothetical protein
VTTGSLTDLDFSLRSVMCGRTYARRASDVRRVAERAGQALQEISSRE